MSKQFEFCWVQTLPLVITFLLSHSCQVFQRKVWLSEILKFYLWAQEEDNAYLKLKVDITAEAGPPTCPVP